LDEIAGQKVERTEDYSVGLNGLPKSDVLKYFTASGSVVVRPSGTEPKLKTYISVTAKDKAAAELAAQKNEMTDLFGAAQGSVATYQPKTQVRKRIHVLNPEGFMQVVGMWWAQVGCTLSVEELEKEFKKQLTYCSKLANDKENPVYIQSEHIEYVEDVKAK
jgi:hypothetical protein